MSFLDCLATSPLILTECAISERLRRHDAIELHPQLFNTPLIYDKRGRVALTDIYQSYRNVALDGGVPLLLCAPTWRIDKEQTSIAKADPSILFDAISFMKERTEKWNKPQSPVFTGALLAPKNDCYSAGQSLSRSDAGLYHSWQIEKMCHAGAEVIIAQTMPAVNEALGMADVLAETDKPYIISFVIDNRGMVLDDTPLWDAIQTMDNELQTPPTGYMVNCVYPTFIRAETQPVQLFDRLLGIQANSSSKSHNELDGAKDLQQDPLPDWGKNMLQLHLKFGVKILGGCCGTDDTYLQYLIDHLHT